MVARGRRVPNTLLRAMRRERGWSLARVAEELRLLAEAEDENHLPGVNADMVGVWERGYKTPGPYYRALLCKLYQRPASQLGFISAETTTAESPVISHQPMASMTSSSLPYLALANERTRALDLLCDPANSNADRQASVWLTLGASGIGQLFDLGWTLEAILASLQTVLQSVQAMPSITRRQLLQLSGAAVLGSVPIPTGAHITEKERARCINALGESIGSGWKLFQTAGNAEVLAVGQVLLFNLQRCRETFFFSEQSAYYSSVYFLIGIALHHEGRIIEALKAHHQAYLISLEVADVWHMAQSWIWQAYGLEEQGQYSHALEAMNAALKLISTRNDIESMRTTAHILASTAEIMAQMNDVKGTHAKLSTSRELLEHLPGTHEEFDVATWHEVAGVCALHSRQYDMAVQRLQQAIEEYSPNFTLRKAATFIALIIAQARLGERDASLEIAEKALPLVRSVNAQALSKRFTEYITNALSEAFPHDIKANAFITDMRQRLA